jgi:predicted MFS family arabinose efflux permease
VQSYILNATTPERRTQGASIIVFGFQGGMISGMAIGSLLVGQLGTPGVFMLAALIAIAMSFYVRVMVPDIRRIVESTEERLSESGVAWRDLLRVVSNADFIRTMLMIGIPAKAVLTGVIIFAMPLLMTRMGYAQEDIGQILMVYAAGVLVASSVISRLVDRSGKTDGVLFAGALASGAGLIIISMAGWPTSAYGTTSLLVAGTAIVGIAHGFINAPVITHIANSELAAAIGPPSATATYRLLERLGHIGGPLIVGQLFLAGGPEPGIIGLLGAGTVVFGLIFILHVSAPKEATT